MINFALFSLLSGFSTLLLGLVVFLKNPGNKINRVFFLFSFFISLWLSGSSFLLTNCDRYDLVLLFDHITYWGVIFIPPTLLYLNTLLAKEKEQKLLIFFGYLVSTLFFFLSLSDKFIYDMIEYPWGCHTKAGLYHHFFIVYFVIFVIFAFVKLFIAARQSRGEERTQLKYVLLAFSILSFGMIGFLPAYGIPIYPLTSFFGLIAVIIIFYAIVKHRLLDIRFVLRQYAVYLLSIVLILVPFILITRLLKHYPNNWVEYLNYVLLVAAVMAYPRIKEVLYRMANLYFFTSLYDERRLINNITDKLKNTLREIKIYEDISQSLIDAFHPKALVFLVYDQKNKKYEIKYQKGLKKPYLHSFADSHDINSYLREDIGVISMEEIKKSKDPRIDKLLRHLKSLKAEIVVSMNIKDKLVGLLVLGEKEARDAYNKTDLRTLNTIGIQAAIAINNALSYEEIKNFSKKLEKEVTEATHDLRVANKKLKMLDAAKSEFVSIASHQLRTPLTVVKGYISMITEGNFGPIDPKIKEALSKVFASNERLIRLVENLLNISRIESGRMHFNFSEVRIDDIVTSVFEELKTSASEKGLKFSINKPSQASPAMFMDPEKIRQVVMNLVDNSIKYTNSGFVSISLENKRGSILFCVKDSGVGISRQDLQKLFKKFSRGTDISLVHTEGTGLGLYVAREIINAHHGRIWAASDGVGQGSCFCFELPILKDLPPEYKFDKMTL